MSDGERVQGILDIHDKVVDATGEPIRGRLDKLGNSQHEGVWSEEYGTLREYLEPFAQAASGELIQAITERVREQRLFTEEEVERAARRFDYHATGVLEFAQVKEIRDQMEDDGESFEIEEAIASVTLLDQSGDAFVPRLPGKNKLTLREAIDQNIEQLEFDDEHPLGLFNPLSKDEPEYIDTGQDPLNPEHWGDTEEDMDLLADQRRLVRAGLLRYNETELAEDFDEKSELYTPGDFIREALYATNARLLQEKIARGVEAKLTPAQITAQLQKEYPGYEGDVAHMVNTIQDEMSPGGGIGSWGMYRKILSLYGRGHKLSLATIVGLSAASSATEIGAGVLAQRGIQEQRPNELLVGAGLMMGAGLLRTLQANRTEVLTREIAQGDEGFEGTVLAVIRQSVSARPDLAVINRASIVSSPRALEMQTQRLQKVLASIPADLIPAVVNSLVAGSYIARTSPEGAVLAGMLINTGYSFGVTAAHMRADAQLESARQRIGVSTHNAIADLVNAGGEGLVNVPGVQNILEEARNLAREEAAVRLKYRLAQVGTRGTALAINALLAALGVDVDMDTIVAQSSAQAQVADAVSGTGASVMRNLPQLHELATFYNSIMLEDTQTGKEVPIKNDVRLAGIQRIDTQGHPYFEAADVRIQQGEKYQLVGSPGGGKSTFYEVLYGEGADGGLMTVGGFRFGEVDKRAYRESIGIKPQAVDTIEGSLAANLAGLRFDQDRLLAGQVLAGSHRFREMYQKYQANEPDNYKLSYDDLNAETKAHVAAEILEKERVVSTFVRSQETGLSGGQRQLLGLWRIKFQIEFAKKHQGEQGVQRVRTILLDEPLKELSGELRKEAEALILEWLDDEELTVIMSNHETLPPDSVLGQRLSTLHKIQAENGKVTNIG